METYCYTCKKCDSCGLVALGDRNCEYYIVDEFYRGGSDEPFTALSEPWETRVIQACRQAFESERESA